jgi:DNA-binding transcriptional regulator LsrR (DeoR family)
VQIANEISVSEREAVKRHLSSNEDKLSVQVLNKMLYKYEISLENALKENVNLKMDLDDREIAFKLFFDNKLNATDIKNLIK